ncbi:hypothetical protein SANA_22640 [Gottschalkiaceae bacterium SANA]|nr:hypothetical protein SANA_22640 [Gottschalkiaceae bacterium SANA]
MEWLENQGYKNIEVQFSSFLSQAWYNAANELTFPADFYNVICEKNGCVEKKTIRVKFKSIDELDTRRVFK